jgi:SAM-dependent methyltransferase
MMDEASYIKYLTETREAVRQEYLDNLEEKYAFMDIQPCQDILDVGCGIGFDLEMLGILIRKYEGPDRSFLYGIDANIAMINASKDRLNRAKIYYVIRKLDVEVSCGPSNFYNRILCKFVLQHIKNPAKAVKNMYDSLCDNGLLCIVDTDWYSFAREATAQDVMYFNSFFHFPPQSPEIIHILPNILKENNLKVVQWIISMPEGLSSSGYTHYPEVHTVVAQKIA